MAGDTQHVSFGYPRDRVQRLHIECPQALIHIEADHYDAKGRKILYVSVSGTQDADMMPYVLVTGEGPGQQGISQHRFDTAEDRKGLGLRLVQADHRHTHPATGKSQRVGLAEECPYCRAYPQDNEMHGPQVGTPIALRYLPVGATFRPAPGAFGMRDDIYRVMAHVDPRESLKHVGRLGQVAVHALDDVHCWDFNTQDTLLVIPVALPVVAAGV